MFENQEERRLREMKEIELMMEQARFRAALQRVNEQRSGQSSTGVAGVGGGTLINKISEEVTPPNTVSSNFFYYISASEAALGHPVTYSIYAINVVDSTETLVGEYVSTRSLVSFTSGVSSTGVDSTTWCMNAGSSPMPFVTADLPSGGPLGSVTTGSYTWTNPAEGAGTFTQILNDNGTLRALWIPKSSPSGWLGEVDQLNNTIVFNTLFTPPNGDIRGIGLGPAENTLVVRSQNSFPGISYVWTYERNTDTWTKIFEQSTLIFQVNAAQARPGDPTTMLIWAIEGRNRDNKWKLVEISTSKVINEGTFLHTPTLSPTLSTVTWAGPTWSVTAP
jgi:hypothetical protein